MKYDFNILEHNIKPHIDIENDMAKKKDGLCTFNLRISQGNIEDYATFETITGAFIQAFIKELGISHSS